MDDKDFFDHIYQVWAKTTGAESMYWQPIEHDHLPEDTRRWSIDAVDSDQSAIRVAAGVSEADADFITAVHGCFADLIRRLTDAIDESDRLDEEKDGLIVRIAELEGQADTLHGELNRQEDQLSQKDESIRELESEIRGLEGELSHAMGAQ